MAGNINRTVSVGLDAKAAEQGMSQLQHAGERMFDSAKQKAEQYTKKLDEQASMVQSLLRNEKERLQHVIEGNRIEAQMQADASMAALDPKRIDYESKRTKILDEQKRKLEEITKEYKEQVHVINEAKQKAEGMPGGGGAGAGGTKARGGAGGRAANFAMGAVTGAGMVAMISAIPGVGQILGNFISAGLAEEKAQNRLRATTGLRAGTETATALGMRTPELAEMMRQTAITKGGTKGIREDVVGQVALERRFGLGRGQTSNLQEFSRFGGESSSEMLQKLMAKAAQSKLWNIDVKNGKIEGFTQLGEKADFLNTLMQKELESTGGISGDSSLNLLTTFKEFEGRQSISRIQGMDEAIKSGGTNEITQDIVLSAIQAANPEMGLFDLNMKQAQGIYGEGNLAAILEKGRDMTSTDNQFKLLLTKLDPSLMGKPEALNKLIRMDPDEARRMEMEQGTQSLIKSFGIGDKKNLAEARGTMGVIEKFDIARANQISMLSVQAVNFADESFTTALKALGFETVSQAEKDKALDKSIQEQIESFKAGELNLAPGEVMTTEGLVMQAEIAASLGLIAISLEKVVENGNTLNGKVSDTKNPTVKATGAFPSEEGTLFPTN